MKIRFLGANHQVTGSRYIIEAAGLRLMLDCGMFQERPFLERNWAQLPFSARSIDAMLLTHAHLDHCGLIPRLVQQGFDSPIYCTASTVELAELIMLDSARIQEEDAAYKCKRHDREKRTPCRPVAPLYTQEDARRVPRLLRATPRHQPLKLSNEVQAVFYDAGHILGATSIEISATENGRTTRALFSGDLGQWGKPFIHDPELLAGADAVVLESTYGDRTHDHSVTVEAQIEKILRETIGAGGNVVIPTFAMERAQELVFYIGNLVRAGKIPRVPVYLDSPMATDVTDVFKRHRAEFNPEAALMLKNGDNPFSFPGFRFTRSVAESQAINHVHGPCIIMATAGMCTGGRIKHHLRQNVGRRESTIVFVGYQSEGTLGREILEGKSPVRIHGQMFDVRARIAQIAGMSAHGDQSDLLRWAGHFSSKPRTLFLTHGEESASQALAGEFRKRMGWNVVVPDYGQEVDLTS